MSEYLGTGIVVRKNGSDLPPLGLGPDGSWLEVAIRSRSTEKARAGVLRRVSAGEASLQGEGKADHDIQLDARGDDHLTVL